MSLYLGQLQQQQQDLIPSIPGAHTPFPVQQEGLALRTDNYHTKRPRFSEADIFLWPSRASVKESSLGRADAGSYTSSALAHGGKGEGRVPLAT